MNSRRQHRKGQATVELLIAMIGLLVALAAVLQVSQTGYESIRNLAEARGDADQNARNQSSSFSGDTIGNWSNGADELRYTADDETTLPPFVGLGDFKSELTGGFDLPANLPSGFHDELTPDIVSSSIGLTAAMYEGEATRTVHIESALEELLFLTTDEIELNDRVYMPGFSVDQF